MASNTPTTVEAWAEPSLDELFAEPIVQLIMERDGVNATDMRGYLNRILSRVPSLTMQ